MNSGYETGRFANAGDLGQVRNHDDVAQVAERMLSERFPESPTWKIFAEALVMASGYE